MGLNKSNGNMYKWVTHTWNTVKGKCPHDCSYCYMKRFKQNPVRFDSKELNADLGSSNFIFVGSSCDMWADDIPLSWIDNTIKHCCSFDNAYLFQSKNPVRFKYTNWWPERGYICTTIETNRYYPKIMGKCNIPEMRAIWMSEYSRYRYVTIEPIMDFDLSDMVRLINLCNPVQVNIGADSGHNNLPEPSKEKILELISELIKFTKVEQKKNLNRLLI